MTDPRLIAVCDAGPLIHLDEVGCLDLLGEFEVWVSPAVWHEVELHRAQAFSHSGISFHHRVPEQPAQPGLLVLRTTLLLDLGEFEALTLMAEVPQALFLTDDSAARLAAQYLGYRVHGTIGILLRAIRRGLRTPADVIAVLERLPMRSSLHIRPGLLKEIIEETKTLYHLE